MKYELEPYNRDIPEGELLGDLRRVAEEIGKNRVTIDEYNDRGRFHATTLTRRFGSWFVATDKAGLERTRNLNIANEELFANLVDLWTALGRQPRYQDLSRGASHFCSGTYEKRFGSWRKALAAFVQWANEGQSPPPADVSPGKPSRRTPRNINWRLRALVLLRDGACCRLCGAVPGQDVCLHVDHVKPWSKGGETVLENLQILCNVCNIGKSDTYPGT